MCLCKVVTREIADIYIDYSPRVFFKTDLLTLKCHIKLLYIYRSNVDNLQMNNIFALYLVNNLMK